MPAIPEADFRAILTDALAGLKGLGKASLQKLLDEYAPRFARLAAATDPVAAAAERDALLVNLKLAGRIAGIQAETVGAKAAVATLKVAAGILSRVAGVPLPV